MRSTFRCAAAVLFLSMCFPALAAAQAELTGTYVRYAGMGSNGTLINSALHSFQYTESGATPYSCDAFYPGSPVEGFTITATAGGVPVTATNDQSTTSFTTTTGPTVSGRFVRWTGRYTSGATAITVTEELEVQATARNATLTTTVTNSGSTSLTNLYYLRNADPDHASCGIGSDTSTNNDVRRQPPGSTGALVTASGGSPMVVLGIGAHDTRARVTATGFNNTDGPGTWASPVDPAGALDDVATDIVFRETSLPIGVSTTFVIHYVFGSSVSVVESRFDALAGASCGSCDDGNPCTIDSCSSGVCRNDPATGTSCDDGSWCTVADACTSSGLCRGTARACDDFDSCTTDRCDEPLDRCAYDPITTGMCAPDSGVPPRDAGGEPEHDAGVDPEHDAGVTPDRDAGTIEPEGDGGIVPGVDAGPGGGETPDFRRGRRGGGCSTTRTDSGTPTGWLALLFVLVALRAWRRRR